MSPRIAAAGLAPALVANLIWSANYVFTRGPIADFTPIVFACLGSAITGIVLTLGLLASGRWRGSWRDTPWVIAGGAVGLAVNWASYGIAQANAPVSHTAFLVSMTPLFLIPLTAFVDRERVPWRVVAAAGLATLGVWILVSQEPAVGDYPNLLLGDAFALLAAATYALLTWFINRAMRSFSAPTAVCVAQYGAAPTLAIVATLSGAWHGVAWSALQPGDWLDLVIVQILGGAGAPVLFFGSVALLGTVRAGMVLYLQPVLGAVFGMILLGERPGWSVAIGGALILAAVIMAQLPKRKRSATGRATMIVARSSRE